MAAGAKPDKAMATWRGICRADHTGSKAEFAHRLAAHLSKVETNGQFTHSFSIPEYLENAIKHVVSSVNSVVEAVS
jgi:hypothetical protein